MQNKRMNGISRNSSSNSNGTSDHSHSNANGNGIALQSNGSHFPSNGHTNNNGDGISHYGSTSNTNTTPKNPIPFKNNRPSLTGTGKSFAVPFTTSSPLLPPPKPGSAASAPPVHVPLPLLARWSYGVGHVLNDLVASCWFSYLLVFLRTVLSFQSTSAGLLLLIGQIADGMATPVVGFLSDKTESRFGKRRLWILCGSIAVALTFPPIFHTEFLPYFATSNTLRVVYYGFFIVLFQFAWACVQVSHLALVPELTREPSERVFLNSLRSIFTILSNVTVFVLAWYVIRNSGGEADQTVSGDSTSSISTESLGPADVGSFFTLSLYVVFIGSIFSFLFIVGTPVPVPRVRHTARVEWYHWFYRPEFYQTAIIYTCTRLLVNVSQTYMPLYLLLSLQAPKATIASVPLTVFGAGLLATCVCERLTRKLGSEGLTLLGCLTVLGSCIGIVYLPREHWQYIYGISCLLGAGTGIVGVSALSLICNLVGESCESAAFVYGSMSFSDKIANGVVIMITEALSPSLESGAQHLYYRNVMLYAPGGAACLAILMLGTTFLRTNPHSHPCSKEEDNFEANLSYDPATSASQYRPSLSPDSPDTETSRLIDQKA